MDCFRKASRHYRGRGLEDGVCGLLGKVARVFPICEPASYYYRVMTRSHWMPVLIGERF